MDAESLARSRLSELIGGEAEIASPGEAAPADFIVDGTGYRLLVEVSSSGDVAHVDRAARRLAAYVSNGVASAPAQVTAVIAVPYMGTSGKAVCEAHGVSWLDLSGNANIRAPGLRIYVEGKANKFRSRGRPTRLFAPKSSRVARRLLQQESVYRSQRWLAEHTDLSEGYVSRITRRLERLALIKRNEDRQVAVRDPELMLDAWAEEYRFSELPILKGYVPAKDGMDATRRVAHLLREQNKEFAATGLASAWCWTMFSAFRITTFYVSHLQGDTLETLGIQDEERGANVWIAEPEDAGVLWDVTEREGIPCVGSVQTYLDLLGHPERAQEAAHEIRRRYMPWSRP